ncbi:peptide MFS transporter [Chitinophagaceae bacterium MMS25-I14]
MTEPIQQEIPQVPHDMAHTAALEQIQNFPGKYPKQLWSLFFSEMWERFCFYGNRSLLTIFMVEKLSMTDSESNLKYGAIQAFVYAFTFIGGLFADKILGFRKSLFWGGSLMILGSLLLFIDAKALFFPAMCLMIVGTGFFKPNISTMVGELYKEGDPRRDAGFGLFYSGINIGALFAGIVCVYAARHFSWNIAFGLSGLFMFIGLINFIFTQRSLGPIGLQAPHILANKNRKRNEIFTYVGSLIALPAIYLLITNTQYTDIFMYIIGPATLVYLLFEMRKYSVAENKKLVAALVFIIFSIVFWAFFEQSGGSLNLFAANNLKHDLLGFDIDPNIVNNSSNSFFVILFSPLIGLLWVGLAKRKLEPNALIKFGIGFLFLALAFYVFYYTRTFADSNGITSLNIFTLAYFVITFGELFLSPIGLSLMTKLSPKPLWGVMMGMWFLASAYGQYAAGLLGAGMASPNEHATPMEKLISYTDGYKQLAIYALVAGVLLIIISPLVRKLMQEVK